MAEEIKLTIPKVDFLKIVDVLDQFSDICASKGVKFGKYSDEQLLEVLHCYRNYKTGDPPPF